MPLYLCITCGTQYPRSETPPSRCSICDEERQFVNHGGQSWTTLDDMIAGGQYANEMLSEEPGLYSLSTKPKFAIGQTAYFVEDGNYRLLWDCIPLLDGRTKEDIAKLGGIQAIALSHPHYYSTQVEWAEAFGVPVYIHEDDREWVVRDSERLCFWSGEKLQLSPGLVLHRLGGHYKGGAVLHWAGGSNGKGVLLTGDIIQTVSDRRWVSFMYSYPNLIPLPAFKVADIADKVKPLPFDRLYNAFHSVVNGNANEAVQKSARRYIAALDGTLFET